MKKFSISWIGSKKPRKQRKYRLNAPLHIKQKFAKSHLSKELAKKYKKRSVILKKGDKVKIMRGQFKKKIVKVERIDLKKNKAYLTGIELIKKEGSKTMYPIDPSNLMITELAIEDKNRRKSIEKGIKNG